MRKTMGGRGLCVLLAFSVALSGCTSIRTQYHPREGENAALKVAPYWRGMSGQRHFISNIAVEVIPLGKQDAEPLYGTTDYAQPLTFENVKPGRYRLLVREEDKEHVSQTIELRPGQELSVRVKLSGHDTTRTIGRAVLIVLAAAAIAGLLVLGAHYDRHHKDDDDCPYR